MAARVLAAFLFVLAMPPSMMAAASTPAERDAAAAAGSRGLLQLAQAIPPTEYGYSLPSVAMAGLRSSNECAVSLPVFGHPDQQYVAPHGTISMSNDGGWCWIQFSQVFRALPFVPSATVIDQPANGSVTVERMKDRVSVAYRPSPGFTGTDRFVLKTDGPLPHTIPFAVTVG
jgi:hypothetical protein